MTKIHESPYGEAPNNFHVSKSGDTLSVELTYPPWTDDDNKNNQCRYVYINQESVRASDGIRVYYDYTRDGFVVQQPRHDGDKETWHEVGFFKSWAGELEAGGIP